MVPPISCFSTKCKTLFASVRNVHPFVVAVGDYKQLAHFSHYNSNPTETVFHKPNNLDFFFSLEKLGEIKTELGLVAFLNAAKKEKIYLNKNSLFGLEK